MKISILQPRIERGNIKNNIEIIQTLINNATGDLLILAEYALTGSLALEKDVNIKQWVTETEREKKKLLVPDEKKLLINSLIAKDDGIYNACSLLPNEEILQIKNYLDKIEEDAGILSGNEIPILTIKDKKVVIVICSDLKEIEQIQTEGADFIIFIFHFTVNNYENVMNELIYISKLRKTPIIVASLVSDKNYGHSCYIHGETVVSLGNEQSILEITI